MSRFFYNTNGFAFHRLADAVRILADLGYDGVALTPDVHHLDPGTASSDDVRAFRQLLAAHGLDVVIETGARFVLDPSRKHRPNLLDDEAGRRRRLAFLEACVRLAVDLGADVVTVWAGALPEGLERDEAVTRLVEGLHALCAYAHERGVRIGFEPEPGMLVARARDWPALRDAVGHPALGLTLDVGHCLATEEGSPADAVRAHGPDLLVVQLDDHRRGTHEHLALGEGEVDFGGVAAALRETGFAGPLEVELSRHSSTAPDTARRALSFLRDAFSTG